MMLLESLNIPLSAPVSVCYLDDLNLKICDQEKQAKCYF